MNIVSKFISSRPMYVMCKANRNKIIEADNGICPFCGEKIRRNHSMSVDVNKLLALKSQLYHKEATTNEDK